MNRRAVLHSRRELTPEEAAAEAARLAALPDPGTLSMPLAGNTGEDFDACVARLHAETAARIAEEAAAEAIRELAQLAVEAATLDAQTAAFRQRPAGALTATPAELVLLRPTCRQTLIAIAEPSELSLT